MIAFDEATGRVSVDGVDCPNVISININKRGDGKTTGGVEYRTGHKISQAFYGDLDYCVNRIRMLNGH